MKLTDTSPTITFVNKTREAIEPKTMPKFTKDDTNRSKENGHKIEKQNNNCVTQHATLSQNNCSEVRTQQHIKLLATSLRSKDGCEGLPEFHTMRKSTS